jgi:hypothetical protein
MRLTSSRSFTWFRLAAALALVTAAGCNNFKKGTPLDGGPDGGSDARPAEDAAAGHGGSGGHGGNGGAGGEAGRDGGTPHDASTDHGVDAGTPLPTANLVAYYPFNDNTNDESGNDQNAVANLGAFDTDRFGRANRAYNLIPNAGNDWYGIVAAPTLPLTTDMTIAAWVKVAPANNNERIAGIGGGWIALQFSGQQVTFGNHGDQPAIVTDPNAITKNTWTFLVGTVSSNAQGDLISLYRDGTMVASNMFTDYYLDGIPGNCRFYMGNLLTGGTTANCTGTSQANEFPGDIDDVRVYSRALSGTEIQALFDEQP